MMKSDPSLVAIKGAKHGLTITLLDGEVSAVLAELAERLTRTAAFFKGAQVTLNVEHPSWSAADLQAVDELLRQHDITLRKLATEDEQLNAAGKAMGLTLELTPSEAPIVQRTRASETVSAPRATTQSTTARRPLSAAAHTEPESNESERAASALVVRRTLRSGTALRHDGHIVLIGDVNPGAEVIARGDVVIWGKLRGMVHAGALGDPNAIVCALHLEPTQLRIANSIARMPERKKGKPAPEMASMRDGRIEVVEWN